MPLQEISEPGAKTMQTAHANNQWPKLIFNEFPYEIFLFLSIWKTDSIDQNNTPPTPLPTPNKHTQTNKLTFLEMTGLFMPVIGLAWCFQYKEEQKAVLVK